MTTFTLKELQEGNSNKPLIEWLSCTKGLLELGFSLDEINKALKQSETTLSDLTDTEKHEQGKTNYFDSKQEYYELINDHTTGYFKEVKIIKGKEFVHEYQASAKEYRVQAHYQGLKHEKIISKLLENRFKWFSKFKWRIYEFRYNEAKNYEIYLETSLGTLYVPVLALMRNDPKIINERMLTYCGSYRSGKDVTSENSSEYQLNGKRQGLTLEQYKEQQKQFYEKEIAPLASRVFEQLKKFLEKERSN